MKTTSHIGGNEMDTTQNTKYNGIHRQLDRGQWWIFDDNGYDEAFDHRPTDDDVKAYRDRLYGHIWR